MRATGKDGVKNIGENTSSPQSQEEMRQTRQAGQADPEEPPGTTLQETPGTGGVLHKKNRTTEYGPTAEQAKVASTL